MAKIYLGIGILAIVGMAMFGVYKAGMTIGELRVAKKYSEQMVERQRVITKLTLDLAKAEKEIDEKTIETVEVIRNVKDPNACADVVIPLDVESRVR